MESTVAAFAIGILTILKIVVDEWREQRKWRRVREAAALKLANPADPASTPQDAVVSALADEEVSHVVEATRRVKADSIQPESK